MPALDLTSFQTALKQMYPKSRIENMVFKNNPLFALMPKDDSVGGENWKVPVQYEDIAGRASTFSIAQANKNVSRRIAFLLTSVTDYALASVEGRVWRATQGNSKAFLEASKSELDSAFNAMKRSIGIKMYRTGTGSVGQIDATVAGTTLTFANRRQINNVGRGMKIVFSATDGGALRDAGEALTINSVNRAAGSCVVSANLNTIAGLTAGDFISIEGDAANGGTNICMAGLQSWLPATAPTVGDNFFGADRSVDSVRLAGCRINCTGLTIEESLIRAVTEVAEQGGSPDYFFVPFNVWEQLSLELGSRKVYEDVATAGINFKALAVQTPEGTVKVVADRNCPVGYAFLLTMSTWTLYSIGACPGILDLDNIGAFCREGLSDSYELRVGAYDQIGCTAPGWNAELDHLPTT